MLTVAAEVDAAGRKNAEEEPKVSQGSQRRSLKEKRMASLTLAEARMREADARWSAMVEKDEGGDMGGMERDLMSDGREMMRAALEKKLQKRAEDTPPHCPVCGAALKRCQWRDKEILSRFGKVRFARIWGRCPRCRRHFAPADHGLGIEGEGKNSPEMRDQLRLLGSVVPPGQVERLSQKVLGFPVDEMRVSRELERGGLEEIERRDKDVERASHSEGAWEMTHEIAHELPDEFVMVVSADGFMTRERDHWGLTERMRAAGESPKRWHETKAGTVFLLGDRVRTGSKSPRPVILRRSFIATRQPAHEFGRMLYAQAVKQGLLLAAKVYFVADGGVWLWNIYEERFEPLGAQGSLDNYHAIQHLAEVARARFGEGEEAQKWLRPLAHQLRHGGEMGVLNTLEEMAEIVEGIEPEERNVDDDTILREWQYFNRHRKHLQYEENAARGLPIGSGCIESTCKQYQLRVKRCGQFWTTERLEGMLCLYGNYLTDLWFSQN